MCEKKTTHAKHEVTIKSNIRGAIEKRPRSNLDIRHRPRLRLRTNNASTGNQKTLELYSYRRQYGRILPIPKGILPSCRHTKHFPRKKDRTFGHQTPEWLHDIIVVTRGMKEKHTKKLYSALNKLENEGYEGSKKKSNFYQKETIWLGHTISQDGIRPNKEKRRNKQKLGHPTNIKTLIFSCG